MLYRGKSITKRSFANNCNLRRVIDMFRISTVSLTPDIRQYDSGGVIDTVGQTQTYKNIKMYPYKKSVLFCLPLLGSKFPSRAPEGFTERGRQQGGGFNIQKNCRVLNLPPLSLAQPEKCTVIITPHSTVSISTAVDATVTLVSPRAQTKSWSTWRNI